MPAQQNDLPHNAPAKAIARWTAVLGSVLIWSTSVSAEALPLPQVDYVASARNEGQPDPMMVVRHHGGVMRLEIKVGARMFPVLIDYARQTATLLVDSEKLAGEAPPGAFPVPKPGVDNGATRLGSDIVADEACEIWKYTDTRSQLESMVCITNDGIWMRQSRPGEEPPRFQVLKLERVAQDPALFQVPSDYKLVPFNQLPLN